MISKAPTGIGGFDRISGGGLPKSGMTLLVGKPGAGKTIFALRSLVEGARARDESGIFVAFEESAEKILDNAASFGWNLPELIAAGKIFVLDARLLSDLFVSGRFDLSGLLAGLEAKVHEIGARSVVFDALDVLLAFLDDPAAEREEVYRLERWVKDSGLTGIVTARAGDTEPLQLAHYNFMLPMADCLVVLHYDWVEDVALRGVRIGKFRGSGFAENVFPMVISATGPEVMAVGLDETDYPVSSERISTGVDRLDTMLAGGYYRGSCVLISGAPGSAKSTLCAGFVEAACRRGERALYVSFDEAPAEIIRNLKSVNIDLAPHVESGLLLMHSSSSSARSAVEHVITFQELIQRHDVRCFVVDPLSAMIQAGGVRASMAASQHLVHLTKSRGITSVFTSLMASADLTAERSEVRVSTVADTWMHLSFAPQGGERNRAITVIKSRGTAHSNQVRELVLSSHGPTLADVYAAEGEVLMGTRRWEKEQEEEREWDRMQLEAVLRKHDLEHAEVEMRLKMEGLQRDMERKKVELALSDKRLAIEEAKRRERMNEIQRRRGADVDVDEAGHEPARH
jgi:circadian clock protein KaiC